MKRLYLCIDMWLNLLIIAGIVFTGLLTIFWLSRNFFVTSERTYASNTKRIFAAVFDLLILNIISGLVFMYVYLTDKEFKLFFKDYMNDVFDKATTSMENSGFYNDLLYIELIVVAVFFVYGILMELTPLKGTLGMHVFDLEVGTKQGKRIGIIHALIRLIMKPISVLILPLNIIISKSSSKRQWIHDRMSQSYLFDHSFERR